MPQKPETLFRHILVLPFLKTLKNTHVFPIQQISIRGVPDLLLCISGTFLALELKTNTGKLHPLQVWNLAEVKRCKGQALVASPANWEEMKIILSKLDAGEAID